MPIDIPIILFLEHSTSPSASLILATATPSAQP